MRVVRTTVVLALAVGAIASAEGRPASAAETPVASAAVASTATPVDATVIPIRANDLVYDRVHDVVWASVDTEGPGPANSVVPITRDGRVGQAVPVGSEPHQLAVSADGAYLYVGLDGAAAVRRVDLSTRVAGLQWPLAPGFCGGTRAADIAVLPGGHDTVAVSRAHACSPATLGVTIYDAGVPRPTSTNEHTGPYLIAASSTVPNRLYGYNNQHTGFGTYKVDVTTSGAVVAEESGGLLSGFVSQLAFDGGLLSEGRHVVDAEAMTLLGSLPNPGDVTLLDAAAHRAYSFNSGNGTLNVSDLTTFVPVDSFVVEGWDELASAPGFQRALTRFSGGPFVTLQAEQVVVFDPAQRRGAAGEFTPLTPQRVLDTRLGVGTGGAVAPLGPGARLDATIAGVAGVPAAGVDAVVLNATVAAPTASTFLTVWPAGTPQPGISSLNAAPGITRANLVTVALGAGGGVSVFNEQGDAHVILDVVGYYATSTGNPGSRFRPLPPARLFDTRTGHGGVAVGPVSAGGELRFDVTGVGGVPGTGVTAIAMNVTAVQPSADSYVTVWPDDTTRPVASNLNFGAGSTVPNLVVMRVPASGVVSFFNERGGVDLLADVVGYYTSNRSGQSGRFVSFPPERIFDTRTAGPAGALNPDDVVYYDLAPGPWGAYVLNLTATETLGAGYVSAHPWPGTAPDSSSLNYVEGETVPNAVVVRSEPGFAFSNFTGRTQLVADIFGAFTV